MKFLRQTLPPWITCFVKNLCLLRHISSLYLLLYLLNTVSSSRYISRTTHVGRYFGNNSIIRQFLFLCILFGISSVFPINALARRHICYRRELHYHVATLKGAFHAHRLSIKLRLHRAYAHNNISLFRYTTQVTFTHRYIPWYFVQRFQVYILVLRFIHTVYKEYLLTLGFHSITIA